ncbi:MAG TPA: hypothetical protein VF787_16200, partial [Thermoanaerobaculia bacterium]
MFRRLAVLVVFALLYAIPAVADNYTLAGAGGNWSNNATWLQNAVPATRAPGSLAGTVDTVNLTASVYTVTLNTTTVENVTLTMTCPSSTSTCLLDIPTGNTLLLSGGSNIGADANLQISGGTIANTGTLTLAANSDLDFTSGDLRGAGTTNVNASAAFNANGGGNMAISASQIVNVFGDFVYVNGLVQLNNAARINIKSGGAFDIQTANGISTNDAVNTKITVESGGLFKKTADPFGTNIDPPLDNNGTVRVDTSTLVLSTGTHTGVFDMNGATTGFEFANTHNFNGTSGSIQGLGLAKLGGPMILGAGADLDITNADTDSFASISGSGTINFSGTFNFRGGTISTATINMLGGSTLNVTADNNAVLTASAHVSNAGIINVSPGAGVLSINSGAHITNNNDINLLGDVTINSDGLASARIDNNLTRTIDKTAGATFAAVNVAVNNAGSVNATSGVLKFTKGGSQTGSFFTGTSCGISFDGGTHQFTGAAALTGTGTYFAAAGLVDIDVPINLGGAISFQQSGGLLTGSGTLTVNGPYLWSAGTQDNSSGSGQTVINGNTSQFTTNATLTLSGRTFVNNGTLAYNPSAGNYLTINNGGLLTNNGVFNYAGDVPINSNGLSTPSFTNGAGGTINKSTGASTAQIFPFFTGNGTINLSSGTITLSGGGQNLGTVNFTSASNKIIVDNTT